MGVVYKARQVNLKRTVALKMILAGQLAGADEVRRFHAEAEAAAKLDHPGIVPIFEVGQHDGQHYFSMAFVEGESLAHKVAQGPFAPREAAALMEKIAEAIAYAHAEGVIHRDLKPANVLIDKDGQPRVTDFGLAKRVQTGDAVSQHTATGQILGTPSYMPPEQAAGRANASARTATSIPWARSSIVCSLAGRRSRRRRRWTRCCKSWSGSRSRRGSSMPQCRATWKRSPQVPGEGAAQALWLGRGTGQGARALAHRRADSRPAGGTDRTRLALVPAQSGGGRRSRRQCSWRLRGDRHIDVVCPGRARGQTRRRGQRR